VERRDADKVYVTTKINFGDRPAGCIAIVAVREMADMFGDSARTC
jgi:hypothetical protein